MPESDIKSHRIDVPEYTFHLANTERLVDEIKAFWAERGQYPEVWIEQSKMWNSSMWSIRSNMLNGRPRGQAGLE